MNANLSLVCLSAALIGTLSGQQNLETAYRTTGSAVTAAFEPQRKVLQTSSAVILSGRKEVGYGVVISPDGYILTKASEVSELEKPIVTVDRTRYAEVTIQAIDPEWDVALLKVEAKGLTPVVFAPSSELAQGTWVVANGVTSRTTRRALAGIISAKPREIPAAGGAALGIVLKPETLEIAEVSDKGGAKEAGVQAGDVIAAIEGKQMVKLEDVAEVLKERKAGSMVKVTLLRGSKQVEVTIRLAAKSELFSDQMNRNDMMSGDVSRRRSGFPRIIQHDIMGSSRITGGPLLDLDGQCVGMNIARANRAESFAIPAGDLKAIAERLMSQASGGNRPADEKTADGVPAGEQG